MPAWELLPGLDVDEPPWAMDVELPAVAVLPLLAGADVPPDDVVDVAEETPPAELPDDGAPPDDEEPATVARQTRRPSCSTQR